MNTTPAEARSTCNTVTDICTVTISSTGVPSCGTPSVHKESWYIDVHVVLYALSLSSRKIYKRKH